MSQETGLNSVVYTQKQPVKPALVVDDARLLKQGTRVLAIESQALHALSQTLDHRFVRACHLMLACQGRVIVMGVGKSGHIGKKIAATLSSTGTPAFFVHPTEACHGDLGVITPEDVVLAISYSGEAQEMITLLPLMKRLGVGFIAITGDHQGKKASSIAQFADAALDISVREEACPLGLAPTASTTATLALGDALAVALLDARGFTAEDFAQSHPGGRLGRRLLLKISDIMHSGANVPKVFPDQKLTDALLEMTRSRLGMTTIVDRADPNKLLGVFTDGDLRRVFEKHLDVNQTTIAEVMRPSCRTIYADQLAAEALQIIETNRINGFPVLNRQNELVGALNLHDLLKAGVL